MKSTELANTLQNYLKEYYGLIKSWRTAQPYPSPSFVIELTYRCNARCKFCTRWEEWDKCKELQIADYRRLGTELKKIGVKRVNLTGGEPFLKENFFDVVRILKEAGLGISVNTNGAYLHKYHDEILNSAIDSIKVSIDSVDPQTHDTIRGTRGLFKLAFSGLEKLRGSNIRLELAAVITRENINDTEKLVDLALSHGIGIRFQPVHNDCTFYNTLKTSTTDILFEPADFEELTNRISSLIDYMKRKTGLNWVDETYYRLIPRFLVNDKRLVSLRCITACRLIYFIDPFGNVFPCESRRDIRLGNVSENSLEQIIKSENATAFREILQEKKHKCFCLYRCTSTATITYQFLPIIQIPKTGGIPIKTLWENKIIENGR